METETPENTEVDPELERRSRRNKIGVTIGFILLILITLMMARLLTSIVKPVGEGSTTTIEAPPLDAP